MPRALATVAAAGQVSQLLDDIAELHLATAHRVPRASG
jgi:hypothetical protein